MALVLTDNVDGSAAVASIAAHLADPTDAHAASAITFTPASGIAAIEVQTAIVEAKTDAQTYADSAVTTHVGAAGAHTASLITNVAAGNTSSVTVQAAINELQGDIDTLSAASHAALTLAAVGSAPSANGATLAAQVLTLQPADATTPGVIANAAQSLPGEKRLAGGVQVGAVTALGGSEIFGVISTTKGSRPLPSMTTAQRTGIGTPATGLMAYDTDLKGAMYYDGTQWQPMDGRSVTAAAQTPAAAATPTILGFRNQILPISGNAGAAVTLTDLSVSNNLEGDQLMVIGTSDTATVTIVSATNTLTNGDVTLGLDDFVCFRLYSSKWREVSRSN